MLNAYDINSYAINETGEDYILVSAVLPSLAADASLPTSQIYSADLNLPALESDSLLTPAGYFFVQSLPMLEISSSAIGGEVFSADLSLPMLEVYVEKYREPYEVAATIPALRCVSSLTQYSVSATLPKLAATSTLRFAPYIVATMPGITASATVLQNQDVRMTLPAMRLDSSILLGNYIESNLTLPKMTAVAAYAHKSELTLPAMQMQAAILGDIRAQAHIALPLLRAESRLSMLMQEVFKTFAMNTENAKVTEYTNYDTLAIGRIGNVYLAIGTDGIYQIGTQRDDGDDVEALVRFGKTDFGSDYQKRLQYAYVGGRGRMVMRMRVDRGEVTADRDVTHAGVDTGTTKLKGGKGARSRYWQPEFQNVEGQDMEIDALNLIAEQTSRRVA